MSRIHIAAVAATLALAFAAAGPSFAETTVTVGGAPMYPSKNIVQNAVNSKDHTTLVAAVKAAGLVPTLESKGPFTVFAPTNEAFAKLPAGTVDTLLKPENKKTLTNVLTFEMKDGKLWIVDAKGDTAQVTIRNVMQSNGVIHVIDTVLLPG